MDFQKWYNQSEFKKFLKLNLLKDSFEEINEQLPPVRKTQFFVENEIYKIGEIKGFEKEISILQIKQKSKNDPRITLTKDTFKLMQDYSIRNALIVFWTDDNSPWRFSLLTTNFTEDFKKELSSPKRYSYILWPGEKIKTPERYLIKDWVVKNFEDLLSRFDVEVVRKEFFKLYVNLFLELYGEIQDNPTFHVLIQQKKIEPVSFAKNLMGKMIFLYFIQKKWWLWIADKSQPFGDGDPDFFKNNFDKLAHDADLFQKHSNFYNDFLEPLFYSGLNKKNPDDWHSTLNMKVPYLNGWLFEEEYEWKSTIIELNNQVFKNIITSFDTYNFTIDEDDPIDREIAVDPEMLGKIFESMISVSKDNIDDIMDVYRKAKEQKHIIHPNPENILNIDIGKEINKKFWAFYTPREIVHYMTKESLIAYLTTKLHEKNQSQSEEEIESIIRKLFDYKDKHLTKQEIESEKLDGYELVKKYVFDIQEALKSVKILDPAVGSGAFPMWILQEILGLRRYLIDTFKLEPEKDFEIKKQIVQNSIHGVDIDPGAVDIARLRFRLSLIVDATEPVPLPNLDFKFVCANTLIPLEEWGLFVNEKLINELKDLRFRYFACSNFEEKETLKKEFKKIKESFFLMDRDKLQGLKGKDWRITESYKKAIEELARGAVDKKNKQILERDPFDASKSNEWFDSQMMFGVDWFDVLIWNPPYIDSEMMVKKMPEQRIIYTQKYKYAKWNWDIFVPFVEKGFLSLKNSWNISFIIPNKLIWAKYSEALREDINKYFTVSEIRDYSNVNVFKEADVYPITFLFKKQDNKNTRNVKVTVMKNEVEKDYSNDIVGQLFYRDIFWDRYFIKDEKLLNIINKISLNESLSWFVEDITAAATVSEAYLIKEKLVNWDSENNLKFINTGSIDPYISFRWKKETTYIKWKYLYPTISTEDLYNINPNRLKQAKKNKLILAWMSTRFEVYYDEGNYLAGKSTSIILDNDKFKLKYILWILNSKLLSFWYSCFYRSLKMAWWYLNFNSNTLKTVPIKWSKFSDDLLPFTERVDQILAITNQSWYDPKNPPKEQLNLEKEIDQMVYELYGLTEDEIRIVEGN